MYRNAISKKLGVFTEFKKKIFQTYITEEDKNLEVKYHHFVAGEKSHTFIEFSI
jgi:hypothetical protein